MISPKQILKMQTLPAVANLLSYTVPATGVKYVVIKEVFVSNIDASTAYLFTMRTTPNGGSAAIDYDAIPVQPVGNDPLTISRSKVLLPGDKVEFFADTASKLNIEVNGLIWT